MVYKFGISELAVLTKAELDRLCSKVISLLLIRQEPDTPEQMDDVRKHMVDEYIRAHAPDPQQLEQSVSSQSVSQSSNLFLFSRQVHYAPTTSDLNMNAAEFQPTHVTSLAPSDSV